MPLVSSVDYVNKRIYLNASTVDANTDTLEVYKEVRELRRTNEGDRKYKPMIIAGGNDPKITGVTATAIFVKLLHGCRIVPYNVGDHVIKLVRDTFTDDGFAGRDCFDRTSLTNSVDIDVDFPEVEVRFFASGSGLSPEQADQLRRIWQSLMLDPDSPVRHERFSDVSSKISFDDVVINATGPEDSDVTATREP
jgi:hypothetical protein